MVWTAKLIKHQGDSRVAVYFEKNAALIAQIKEIDGAIWSPSLVAWHVPDTDENRDRFNLVPQSHSLPSVEGMEKIEKFKQ